MVDIIEHLAEDDDFLRKFCRDCREVNHCPADNAPFHEYGCARERDVKDIEEAVEALEKLIEGVTAA